MPQRLQGVCVGMQHLARPARVLEHVVKRVVWTRAGVPDLNADRTRPGKAAVPIGLPLVIAERPRPIRGFDLLNTERDTGAATLRRRVLSGS